MGFQSVPFDPECVDEVHAGGTQAGFDATLSIRNLASLRSVEDFRRSTMGTDFEPSRPLAHHIQRRRAAAIHRIWTMAASLWRRTASQMGLRAPTR